jgi:hypothetical protein
MVPDYRNVISGNGVVVQGQAKRRHVPTTRRDGWIQFGVTATGFTVFAEYSG